jgi:hypothetical protein
MKLTTTLLAIIISAFSFTTKAADTENKETVVRLLPSKEAGFVKILYMNPTEKKVEIKFYGEKGLIIKEQIRSNRFKGGFIKVYDLSKLKTGDYRIEIVDAGMSITYPFTFDGNKQLVWAKQWNNYNYK